MQTPPPLPRQTYTPAQVEFRGNTREWFGIWIVNFVLSIITLSIYSAWAKVRQKKYFYQHTYVGGRNFDYHATGKQILIGRLIVIAGLVVFTLLSAIPVVAVLGFLAFLFVMPWLVVQSLRFNARMSSWSNVRFGFSGKYGGAAKITLLYPLLAALTLYTTLPYADRARRRFIVNNHRLGKTPFSFAAPISKFYMAALAAIAWVLVVGAVLGFVLMQSGIFDGLFASLDTMEPQAPANQLWTTLATYAGLFVVIAPAGALYYAMTRNIIFNHTTLGGAHAFHSTVPPLRYVWIVVTNAIAIIGSLFLLLPWAQIRKARFLAEHTEILIGGSLDEFVNAMQEESNAIGDAYGDIEGLDLDIGL